MREDRIVFNERGRRIEIVVSVVGDQEINIAMRSPDSEITNCITLMEAMELHDALGAIIRVARKT